MLKKSQRPTKVFVGLLSVVAPLAVVAPVAAADPPKQISEYVEFMDVNPCTGFYHTVSFAVTVSEHSHGERVVVNGKRTVTTDTGFVGRGTFSAVDNGQIFKFTSTDILRNPAGDRIRARNVFVIDLSARTIRVDKGELTCLGPA